MSMEWIVNSVPFSMASKKVPGGEGRPRKAPGRTMFNVDDFVKSHQRAPSGVPESMTSSVSH